jgi:hypothetical protein
MNKLIFVFLFSFVTLQANLSDLVQGTIVDEKGNPIEVSIEFVDQYDKKIVINSNQHGVFSGPVVEGSIYTISIKGYKIDKKFEVKQNNEYDEHEISLIADNIDKGTILCSKDLFETGTAKIKNDSRKILNEIRKKLNENDLKATLLINSADIKGSKNKKKDILKERKKALIMELFKYNISDKEFLIELAENIPSEIKSNLVVKIR